MRTLKPGCGFESRADTSHVGDFIVVDALLPTGTRTPTHMHERAYLSLVHDGGFEEHYGRRSLTAGAGTVIFDPGSTPHRTVSSGARILRIELSTVALERTRELGAVLQDPRLFQQPNVASVARRVLSEVRNQPYGWRLVAEGLIVELLGHTLREERQGKTGMPLWLRRLKERLEVECDRSLSLAMLARDAGVHPIHLARAFRAAYGMSVGAYRRGQMIRRAENLLSGSSESLCDIALRCGFADQSHFSKVFRRSVGLPPGQYRRQCQKSCGRASNGSATKLARLDEPGSKISH